ncbi:MAG: AI-2E family transporter [Cryobacterium sp.]|nr:AI-2E family transporter [Cryobacterium sp.]MBX3309139.1 AI-2E family transporter [Cryobacterium sp.]MCB1280076.1 AI-2E family transporter [Salinibacterium sp.]HNP15669.1 AI-2E family transporter [Terrimesophilobacter sp.]
MKIQNAFRLGLFGGLGVLVAIGIGAAVGTLATIITYIGAAIFLALGLDPAVSWLERHRFPRWLAILTVVVVVLAVFTGLVFSVIPVIVAQTSNLVNGLTPLIATLGDQDNNWVAAVQKNLPSYIDLQAIVAGALEFIKNNITSIGGGVLQVGLGIASGAFGIIIVLILTLYFVASLNSMKRGLYQLIPATKRARFADLAEQISDSVGRYVVGQATLALFNGILSFIYLSIVGAEYPALFAFIAFLFSLVPLVGTLSGSVLITLSCLLFDGVPTAIAVGIYYIAYMQIEAYVLNPNIMNRAVKVPGVIVVIAALSGGTLLGILGALIAIPVAASILLIINQVVVPQQNEL